VELLVLVWLELAEEGAAAEEDPGVVATMEPTEWILGCAITPGLRGTGADDEEIAAINMIYTSGKETTKEINGRIAMCNSAGTLNLRPQPQRFLNWVRQPFWFSE